MGCLIFNFASRLRGQAGLASISLCYALLEMEILGLTSFRALPITFIPRDFAAGLIREIYGACWTCRVTSAPHIACKCFNRLRIRFSSQPKQDKTQTRHINIYMYQQTRRASF